MFFIAQRSMKGLFCFAFLFLTVSVFAQFSLKTDRTKANYSIGETADFVLISSQSGTATYKLKYDNITPTITSGSVSVTANVPATIPFQGTSAEVILCEVILNGVTKTAAAVFESDNIALFSDEPVDFDQFWDNQKNISAAIPLDPQLTFLSNNGDVTNYRINLANVDNRRVYGYISVPNNGGNFPAIITLPPYSSDANTANPQDFIADRAQVLSVTLSVHNAEPDEIDQFAYEPNIINDRNGYYYRYAILGTLRMIDYLYTRSDFDGQNLGVTGVSQGGGLAMIAAGLDERVKSLSVSNPALCRHAGYDQGKASGFPYYVQNSDYLVNDATHYQQTLSASRYYDAAYFARRYMGPTLAVVSYADDVTPAGTSFAALNELRGKKIIVHARDLNHAHPTEYWDGRYNLWRHEFPSTIQLPFYTNTGYWPEAGDDRATMTNTALNLNGQIFQNGINNYDFPVKWDVIDAPGNVTFSNENIANPTAQFDTPGVYLLRFTAYDYGTLMNTGIFHEISDFVYVEVGQDIPVFDTTSPNCQLTFTGFNPGGSLQITATFSEIMTDLNDVDFLITNGTVASLTGSGANYILDVVPLEIGNVRVNLPYGQATDLAGNANLPSNQVSIYISNPPVNNNSCDNVNSGGEINGDESNCEAFDANILANNISPTGGTGTIEYQWQSAPSLAGNWTNISGANTASYDPPFLSETTYFRRLARRANCDDFVGISNAIVKEIIEEEENTPISNAPTGYCAMQGDNPNNVFIRRVELEGLSNESAQEGYGDFTSTSATLAPGGIYMAILTPGNETVMNNWVGWIDYNRDGDFNDERELVIFKNGNNPVNAFFEVPANVVEGATRMRIALRGDNFAAPCYSYTEGEVEDYTIILGSEAGTGGSGGTTTNPSPTTPPSYCTVKGTEPWWQWISRVQFADLDNSSHKEQYGRFTDRFANVEAGSTYELSLMPSFSWLVYDMNWKVWIDFNQDGDFEDTGELVADGISSSEINFDVQIPSSAPAGTTGMRVATNIDEIPNACTDVVRGEFEDYSIVISGSDCGNGNNRFRQILDLVAQPYAREVELHWTTNTEYKNQNFIIEHSLDGVNFVELDQQESLTDGYLPNVYRIKHEKPPLGENIYRVKQIYNNGSYEYSEEKKVLFALDLEEFIPYPNPSSQKLYLPLQKYAGETAHVKIYNNFAQLLRASVVNSLSIEPEEIDVSDLQDGIYYISIEIAGQRTISRAFTVFRI